MKLINKVVAGVAVSALAATASQASTLDDVRVADQLRCVVSTGTIGFSATNADGRWEGFDVDFCRAVAAAVLGSGEKVQFVPTTSKVRFTVLNSNEADILFRNTTETMSRDADLKLTFLPVTYYDGQGFLAPKSLGVSSALELDGASVCIQTGTTTELNLADYFRANNMSYEPVPTADFDESKANYAAGRCDVLTTDASALASTKAVMDNPNDHMVMPEVISKEPLGGAVRQGDDQWADISKWVVNALINAENLGITQRNVKNLASSAEGKDPSVNRLLGTEGNFGEMIGLDNRWAVRAISAVGNYSEIFERNVGPNTPLGLQRSINASYLDGGILYAAPVR